MLNHKKSKKIFCCFNIMLYFCTHETSHTHHIILHSSYHPSSDSLAMQVLPKKVILLFSERILVYSQELLTEVIEELHVIHEITLEEALWLLHATIQPLHTNFLPNLRRTFQCTCLEFDGST